MKNTPNRDLALLARQWGATAVPFGELSTQAWLETPQNSAPSPFWTKRPRCVASCSWRVPNRVGKSALVGHWLHRLDRRLFCPLLLTHASLSGWACSRPWHPGPGYSKGGCNIPKKMRQSAGTLIQPSRQPCPPAPLNSRADPK